MFKVKYNIIYIIITIIFFHNKRVKALMLRESDDFLNKSAIVIPDKNNWNILKQIYRYKHYLLIIFSNTIIKQNDSVRNEMETIFTVGSQVLYNQSTIGAFIFWTQILIGENIILHCTIFIDHIITFNKISILFIRLNQYIKYIFYSH